MSEPAKVDQGRVDHLGLGIFKGLVKKYANPEIKFAVALLEDEVKECFEEHLGPGTTAHEVGRRVMRVLEGGK